MSNKPVTRFRTQHSDWTYDPVKGLLRQDERKFKMNMQTFWRVLLSAVRVCRDNNDYYHVSQTYEDTNADRTDSNHVA